MSIWLLSFLPAGIYAQKLQIIDSINVFESTNASVDNKGNIFLANNRGKVVRITPTLNDELVYSPSTPASITNLEARQGLSIFLFYKELQQYSYLNRFLSLSEKHTFNHPEIHFISQATPSFDNNLWLFDQPTATLFKYNVNTYEIELSNNLEYSMPASLGDIVVFREYQNNLYIGGENSVYIFDNLGNFVNQINLKGNWYGFYKNAIYQVLGEKVLFTDLYSGAKDTLMLPFNSVIYVFFNGAYVYAVTRDKLFKLKRSNAEPRTTEK